MQAQEAELLATLESLMAEETWLPPDDGSGVRPRVSSLKSRSQRSKASLYPGALPLLGASFLIIKDMCGSATGLSVSLKP